MSAPPGREDESPLPSPGGVTADAADSPDSPAAQELPAAVEGVGELVADPLSGAVVPATGEAPAGAPRDDPGPPPEDEVPLSPS